MPISFFKYRQDNIDKIAISTLGPSTETQLHILSLQMKIADFPFIFNNLIGDLSNRDTNEVIIITIIVNVTHIIAEELDTCMNVQISKVLMRLIKHNHKSGRSGV